MAFGKQSRLRPRQQQRRNLQKNLRLEHLEARRVFAGLSPVAVNDLYHAVADQSFEIASAGVLANDSDAEGDTLTALEFRGPANGSLMFKADGTFVYTPNPDFSGTDGFIYQVDDGNSRSHLAAVTIEVAPTAHALPHGENDLYTVAEDGLLGIGSTHGVLSNDHPRNGKNLQAVLVDGPVHGTLEFDSDGSFTYQPNQNFHGSDAFTYHVSDAMNLSDLVTVEITVEAINDAPQGTNDTFAATEDQVLTVLVADGLLANDSDVDSEKLEVVLDAPPQNGILELAADGSFVYTPDANFHGLDAFLYRVDDGTELSELIVVEILVAAANDVPAGSNDAYAINEDETLVVEVQTGVLVNDRDEDGDSLTAELESGPEHGTLALNADGSFTYTPQENYAGPDAFTYRANDGSELSEVIVVELMVHAVNDTPVGGEDAYATNEDETLTVTADGGLLLNDSDGDNDPLTAVLDSGPEHGELELNSDGSFSYTPVADYSGPDAFTYYATDGSLNSELVTVQIMVNAVNDAPGGSNDAYAIDEDQTLTIAAEAGVLLNDSDVDSEPQSLIALLNAGPKHGSLAFNQDGSFVYTPDPDYHGVDAFTYQVSDGSETSALLVVEITVNATNDIPVGLNDAYAVNEDESLTIAANTGLLINDSDIDGDPLQAILESGPQHGTLALNLDGSFTYTPESDYHGTDAFTYLVSDGELTSELVVVEITVAAVNDAPQGQSDAFTVNEDETLTVPVEGSLLLNDSDLDGDALVAVLDTAPAHGTLELAADGSFTYVPNADYQGNDTFSYRVSDGTLTSEVVVVEIAVTPVNDAPVGTSDSYTVNEEQTLVVAMESGVLSNDIDVDGDSLNAVLESSPTHGTLELNADGSFTYVPAENFSGTDSFSYHAGDGALTSEVITVEITVAGTNDSPLAENDSYTATVNQTLTVPGPGVLANDSDEDGDALTAILVDGPSHGQLTLAEDGSFVYQPDTDYLGPDEFTYQASDGIESVLAVVSIRVRTENARPVALNDVYQFDAGAEFSVEAEAGVLKNDSDGNEDLLGAVLFRGPQNGSLTLNSDGSFQYTPNAGFSGLDSFLYRADDGELQSRLAAVTLRVKALTETPPEIEEVNPPSPSPEPIPSLGEGGLVAEGESSLEVAFDSAIDSLVIEDFLRAEFEALLTARSR